MKTMEINRYINDNQSFIFGFDDVIYPEKDYLLQVYYLFAQFIAYAEQVDEVALLTAMKEIYFEDGPADVFDSVAKSFDLPLKYKVNFELLMHNAKLPLKLLLFDEIFEIMKAIVGANKQLFLFVIGDPGMQLNKIKQIDWKGLQAHLVVYFAAEISPENDLAGLNHILQKHQLIAQKTLYIGGVQNPDQQSYNQEINYLSLAKLMDK
jgi:hypothetical protein